MLIKKIPCKILLLALKLIVGSLFMLVVIIALAAILPAYLMMELKDAN